MHVWSCGLTRRQSPHEEDQEKSTAHRQLQLAGIQLVRVPLAVRLGLAVLRAIHPLEVGPTSRCGYHLAPAHGTGYGTDHAPRRSHPAPSFAEECAFLVMLLAHGETVPYRTRNVATQIRPKLPRQTF